MSMIDVKFIFRMTGVIICLFPKSIRSSRASYMWTLVVHGIIEISSQVPNRFPNFYSWDSLTIYCQLREIL